MKTSSVLIVVVLIVLVVSMLSVYFFPSQEDFMVSNTLWNGMKSFAGEIGATVIDSLDEMADASETATLILVPYLEFSDDDLATITGFVRDGGRLLLMDDYGRGNDVLAHLGVNVRFTGKLLVDPIFHYRNLRLPEIVDFADEVSSAGVEMILMNHATSLANTLESSVLARSSESSYLDVDENGVRGEDESVGPFPVVVRYPYGSGEVVVIADPSIVINSVVGKADNTIFLAYLAGGWGEGNEVLVTTSHLPKSTLDLSKAALDEVRQVLGSPLGLLGTVAVTLVVVSWWILGKGVTIGRHTASI